MRQSISFKDVTQLQLQIGILQQEVSRLNFENQRLNQQLLILQKQNAISKQSEEILQQKVIEYENLLKEHIQKTAQLQQNIIQNQTIPNQQLTSLILEKDQLLDDFKEKTWIYKKRINNYESMIAQVQILYSDKIQKKPEIKGLMHQLMEQQYKIKNWKSNPQIKYEVQEFEVIEIKVGKHMNKILDNKLFFLAHEGLQQTDIGKIKALVSTQPNVEGDLQVGYIIEILNADDISLNSQFLLRREKKQQKLSQGYHKKQDAIQQSMNNILCSALFERFRKRRQGYEEFNNYCIQRQFVLKPTNLKIHYYCEMIEEGDFQKFTGGDMEPLINSDLEDFINFYTFDSFQDINEELVVSHLQRVGTYFYDMIISTLIGVYSEYDQGKQEVFQTIKNLERALGLTSATLK